MAGGWGAVICGRQAPMCRGKIPAAVCLASKRKGSCRSLLCIGRLGCFLRPLRQIHHSSPGAGVTAKSQQSELRHLIWSPAVSLSSSLSLALSSGKLFELIELQHLENPTAMLSPVYISPEFFFFFSLGFFFFLMEESHTPTVISEAPSLVQSPGHGCAGQP